MHTFEHENVTIQHNGDFSGDAIVTLDEAPEKEMRIPCKSLVAFSKMATLREVVYAIEAME